MLLYFPEKQVNNLFFVYLLFFLVVLNPFSAKPIFGRKKKFFRKFYSYFSFYAREINFK